MLCYDIFDLADFPVIVTNRNFVIEYKNTMAVPFFSSFRKGSKITRHTPYLDENTDISKLCEIEFTTGMQYKRALVFCHEPDSVFFVFLSSLQFERSGLIMERLKNAYNGNFFDFHIAAYNAYLESQNFPDLSSPNRLIGDLLMLMDLRGDKPSFMKKEIYDITELATLICKRVGNAVSALGMQMPSANISKSAVNSCFCNINLSEFSFVMFKMIYAAFRLSDSKCVMLSLDKLDDNSVTLSVSTQSKKKFNDTKNNSFAFASELSELSLEVMFLKKFNAFSQSVHFRTENDRLVFEFELKGIDGLEALQLRSSPKIFYRQKAARIISYNTSKIKELLSKTM